MRQNQQQQGYFIITSAINEQHKRRQLPRPTMHITKTATTKIAKVNIVIVRAASGQKQDEEDEF